MAYDEHRMGLKPVYRRGERPKAVVAHRYRWFYLCTFVEPETGEALSLLVDGVDTVSYTHLTLPTKRIV